MGSDCAVSNIWPANHPFPQSETELRRTQLNEVGSKELYSQQGTRPWTRPMYAPQPDGLDWESILRREQTGLPGENPQSQVEIDWNSTHIQLNPDNSNFQGKLKKVWVNGSWEQMTWRQEKDDAVHFYSYNVHFNFNLIGSGSGRNLPIRNHIKCFKFVWKPFKWPSLLRK